MTWKDQVRRAQNEEPIILTPVVPVLVGLTVADAEMVCAEAGLKLRVRLRDGQICSRGDDSYDQRRVNVFVEDGVVVSVRQVG